ncbi:phage terminase small subunit P27 family [Pararhizobium gei]|uniref:phage terminase small subunit P27 family n=1 Tax=Pararhizobium gei TaxID=1395951 RepID=UPI0023DA2A87|nr:phage terminase small subunit P27 family [Rhizobium gei]
MSTKGRKADLKVIEGGKAEVSPVPAHIPAEMHPDWLDVCEDLRGRKMLTNAMSGSIDAYIMALWNMRKAQEALDKHGPLIDGGKGILKVNPASSMLGKAQSAVLRLSAELGLTPASRSRPKMKGDREPSAEGDLFGDLMDF